MITVVPKSVKLNNGLEIPKLGLGTYQGQRLEDIIDFSIEIGYRLIDTAFVYQNEKQIGNALYKTLHPKKSKSKRAQQMVKIERDDLFIVSKLWNTKHRPKDVIPAIKQSLSDLQLDYLDLYLVHWPFAAKPAADEFEIFKLEEDDGVTLEETWLAMEECVKQGLTKSIGFSNFNSEQIDRILKICTIKPVVNQVEVNPYMNQKKLIEFCKQRDILIMAYSPFYGLSKLGGEGYGLNMFEEPAIKDLSEKYRKTEGQIILRFLVQLGTIPIPKSDNPRRMLENINIFDFELTSEDMAKLEAINMNLRCVPMSL